MQLRQATAQGRARILNFRIIGVLEAVAPLGLELNLWRVQNIFFKTGLPLAAAKRAAAPGEPAAARWLELFARASADLKVRFNY